MKNSIQFIYVLIFSSLINAMETPQNAVQENAGGALLDFINDSRFPKEEILDFILSNPFVHKGYRFEYEHIHSHIALKNQSYFQKLKPQGVAQLEPLVTKGKVTIRWTTIDSPTPGLNSDFLMTFSYTTDLESPATNMEKIFHEIGKKAFVKKLNIEEVDTLENASNSNDSPSLSDGGGLKPELLEQNITRKPIFLKKPERYEIEKPEFYFKDKQLDSSIKSRISKLINDYHLIDREDRTKLRLRIQALSVLSKQASQFDLGELAADALSKEEYLEKLDAIFTNMGYTPDGKRDWRKGVFEFVKKYMGIGVKGVGFSISGYPLVPNMSSLLHDEDNSSYPEIISKYTDPYGRDLKVAFEMWRGSTVDFYLHLEELLYRAMAFPGRTVGGGLVPREDLVAKHESDRVLKVKEGLLIETIGPNKGKAATGIESIYAIDEFGGLHVTDQGGPGHHHPGFMWGMPVICAGHIKIQSGKIVEINNVSGHYSPTSEHLYYAVKILYQKGVIPNGTIIYSYEKGPLKVEDFVMTYQPKNDKDFWKFKVLKPEYYHNKGFAALIKIINNDRIIKSMIMAEIAKVARTKQKLKRVTQAFRRGGKH